MVTDKESNKRTKEKLGLWREEAKRNNEKNLERDFTKLEVRKVSIHHKGCINICVVKGFAFHCFLYDLLINSC